MDNGLSLSELVLQFCAGAAGQKPTPAASLLGLTTTALRIRSTTDILTISRRLGHRKASVTLDTYGHLVKGKEC